jgi:hypothetical protein
LMESSFLETSLKFWWVGNTASESWQRCTESQISCEE